MAQTLLGPEDAAAWPTVDTSHLVTEDGAAVDSFLAEKQMRLFTEPLYGWTQPAGRPFLVAANVGVFAVAKNPAIVPDVFLSLDVSPPKIRGDERVRSYFTWEFGKPPDVVIEIVSDTIGGELSEKLRIYERMRVAHYVVYDPLRALSSVELSAFSLDGAVYVERAASPSQRFEDIGLALATWEGTFEDVRERWLRWHDLDGAPIATGAERAELERERAELERKRAELERERAERFAAKLRALGIDPEST